MEKIIDLIEKQGLLPTALCILAFLLLALLIILSVALRQGREIVIGPLKLGGRLAASQDASSQGAVVSSSYSVNCSECGTLIPVPNPRPREVPRKVYPRTSSCHSGGSSEGFQIGCPICRNRQYVQFEY